MVPYFFFLFTLSCHLWTCLLHVISSTCCHCCLIRLYLDSKGKKHSLWCNNTVGVLLHNYVFERKIFDKSNSIFFFNISQRVAYLVIRLQARYHVCSSLMSLQIHPIFMGHSIVWYKPSTCSTLASRCHIQKKINYCEENLSTLWLYIVNIDRRGLGIFVLEMLNNDYWCST